MKEKITVDVRSEIGKLEAVILHKPGAELENMTPENAERALYSDILNLSVATKEYKQFQAVLDMHTQTFQVSELLEKALEQPAAKEKLLRQMVAYEKLGRLESLLSNLSAKELSRCLIEGLPVQNNSLTNFLQADRYSVRPLHNFFFTRDASVSVFDNVLINRMANPVRMRESWIMELIFEHSGQFNTKPIVPTEKTHGFEAIHMEGGDLLVAREDTLLVGLGPRTSSQGIDFIVDQFKTYPKLKHFIVQELPFEPESFIHLDMVFTFLDVDKCMVYEPLILKTNRFQTIHIELDHGKVKEIKHVHNLPQALKSIGIDVETIKCGGTKNSWIQEREQWHSGANFFALAPGRLMGYARNENTLNELQKHGFAILPASDILSGKYNLQDYDKYVVAIEGEELARGGGGARCMTMPVRRARVNY